ncbi:hypothetical protein F4779DRAFT_606164 [Xylariaceae sp. FL0662B]|nr:hypothetical protein F4779DRAFT_606164 [Xylariaceae sp. FL0662B]
MERRQVVRLREQRVYTSQPSRFPNTALTRAKRAHTLKACVCTAQSTRLTMRVYITSVSAVLAAVPVIVIRPASVEEPYIDDFYPISRSLSAKVSGRVASQLQATASPRFGLKEDLSGWRLKWWPLACMHTYNVAATKLGPARPLPPYLLNMHNNF